MAWPSRASRTAASGRPKKATRRAGAGPDISGLGRAGRLLGVPARADPSRELGEHPAQRDAAPAQTDDQVVDDVRRLADEAIVALRLERLRELARLFADLGP